MWLLHSGMWESCTDFRTHCPICPNSDFTNVLVVASKGPVGEMTPQTRNYTFTRTSMTETDVQGKGLCQTIEQRLHPGL